MASRGMGQLLLYCEQMGPVLQPHSCAGKISTLTQKQLLPLLVGMAFGQDPGCQCPVSTKLTKDVSLGRRFR